MIKSLSVEYKNLQQNPREVLNQMVTFLKDDLKDIDSDMLDSVMNAKLGSSFNSESYGSDEFYNYIAEKVDYLTK